MMLYPSSQISKHLSNLCIKADDTVFLHGDAGIAAQYIYGNDKDPILGFFQELKTYLSNGTVLVPSFTYSATKGETFDVNNTPSEVGLFSEKFRLLDGVKRSQHPIFSICAFGKHSDYFINGRLDDCFGERTFFDRLHDRNVKIVLLGCKLEHGATFLHYVEQKLNVSYRYFKKFTAKVLSPGSENNFEVNYFVRDLKLNTKLNLKPLETESIKQEKMIIKPFGRFKARSISSQDFFRVARHLICENEYALIGEK